MFKRQTIARVVAAVSLGGFLVTPSLADPTDDPNVDQPVPQQIEIIDEHVGKVWEMYGLSPSSDATEGEWCRRVYLDLIGRIPTVTELNRFLRDREKNKRQRLVDRLLYSDDYVEEFARNWTTIWTNILLGRTGGTGNRDLSNRVGMQKYLRDAFARNKPYDRMVHELISAEGTTVPGTPGFNGAVNFLANKLDEDAALATARTSQVFLGMQVQCTQCHNHPFNEWKQNQFWELNAYFRQTRPLRRFEPGTRDIRYVELTNQDFRGEGSSPEEAEIYYEQRNGVLNSAYPVFVDGKPLDDRSGYVSDVNRREKLADTMVQSEYLAPAIVNRMWAHFLGYGFTKPIDDMGPHNPVSHPELMAYLADQFTGSEYDLKQLMRWIALSRPYALTSRSTKSNASDDPQLGESPKFSHFYIRQMTAEQLYESLLVATEAHKSRGSYEEQEAMKARWLRQFNIAFGTDEGDDTTTFNGSIPQALMLFNGELIRNATSVKNGSFLAKVATVDKPAAKKIEHLYLAALARKPSKSEIAMAKGLVNARTKDGNNRSWPNRSNRNVPNDPVAGALQDIWWALLNSNEFIMNH